MDYNVKGEKCKSNNYQASKLFIETYLMDIEFVPRVWTNSKSQDIFYSLAFKSE